MDVPDISVISARLGENKRVFLSGKGLKTSREGDIPVPGVIFLSRRELTRVSHLFGRMGGTLLVYRPLSHIILRFILVIPLHFLLKPPHKQGVNGQMRTNGEKQQRCASTGFNLKNIPDPRVYRG